MTNSKGTQGDQGIQGVQGVQGIQGAAGTQGASGTAGRKDIHQINVQVEQNKTSIAKITQTVESVKKDKITYRDRRLNFLYVFIVLSFLIGAFFLEKQQQQTQSIAHQNRLNAYTSCQRSNINVVHLNNLITEALKIIEVTNAPMAAKQQSIAVYKGNYQTPFNCGAKPRK